MSLARRHFYRRAAALCLSALIVLTFLWEWQIAPLRLGGSWLALKALPLCLPLSGCLKGKVYTFQYSSMLILPYMAEGVVRLADVAPLSRLCAALELMLSLAFFVLCLLFIRSTRTSSS
ncbi:MAG: DUF2069 domain-containing protein [Neisseria sp.]|nr:DUF2069 domain-containing protein [Neisseria sp.]